MKTHHALIRYLSEVDGFVPWTWWPHEEVGHTDEASKEVTEIIGASAIQGTPKPVRLIKRIIEMYTDANANDIVLDSFAGSGTTAHAVLQANMVDGGNRRFILIQQPFDTKDNKSEKFNICKSVTGERVRKVILGYKSANKRKEKILEKQITLDVLRKPEGLLAEIEKVKEKLASRYNDFKIEIINDTVSLIGQPSKEGKVKGLGGSFTYVRVGDPLLTEYRTFQGKRPSYEKLASYIYYTETNRQLNQKTLDKSESLIGSIGETAFFLLYDEKAIDGLSLTLDWLESKSTKYKHKSWVIYTERIWIHRDDREAFEKRAGKYVRLMHLPFHLK